MHEVATPAWVAIAYLISGVCFILALRGLSSPVSSRRGNRFGMFGMTVALVTTLVHYAPRLLAPGADHAAGELVARFARSIDFATFAEILAAIAAGAAIGLVTARRIPMTAMPQLVAAFHSLVGMAAVLVAAAAYLNPQAFGIAGADGIIHQASRIEMGLGVAIGAITWAAMVLLRRPQQTAIE